MSRGAIDSRNVMLQAEDHLEFAQAEYYLPARQLQEALQEEHEEEGQQEEDSAPPLRKGRVVANKEAVRL